MNLHNPIEMLPVPEAAKLRGTGPVSSRPYYDPDWWELERKAIFMRTWIWVGHVCELPEPGTWIRRELEFANASILIVRGKDNVLRAFHDTCRHRGAPAVDRHDTSLDLWPFPAIRRCGLCRAGLLPSRSGRQSLRKAAGCNNISSSETFPVF